MKTWNERLAFALQKRGKKQAELARAAEVSGATASDWVRGEITMIEGENAARACDFLRIHPMWLFFGRQPSGLEDIDETVLPALDEEPREGYVRFNQLDQLAAAGPGAAPVEYPQVVQRLDVLETWARRNLGDLSKVQVLTARGTSMHGTIENGDLLFVDTSVNQWDGDGIYVISHGDEDDGIQVKRLQKLPGRRLAVISDNRRNKSVHLTAAQTQALRVHGRVLAAWTIQRLW